MYAFGTPPPLPLGAYVLYGCSLTAMVEVPGELETVCGEVEVPYLMGEHGEVALLPRRDGQVVARRVVAQRDVLHPGQFLCGCYITGWRHSRHLLYFEIFGAISSVNLHLLVCLQSLTGKITDNLLSLWARCLD